DFVFLDIDTREHSCFEIIKYINMTAKKVKVVLTVESPDRLEEYNLDQKKIKKLGIYSLLFKPFDPQIISTVLNEQECTFNGSINSSKKITEQLQEGLSDELFSSLNLDEFFWGNNVIFDLYIRLD